jgi:hypothetical protein
VKQRTTDLARLQAAMATAGWWRDQQHVLTVVQIHVAPDIMEYLTDLAGRPSNYDVPPAADDSHFLSPPIYGFPIVVDDKAPAGHISVHIVDVIR